MNDEKHVVSEGNPMVMVCGAILIFLALIGLHRKYNVEDYKMSALFQYDKPLMEWARGHTPEDANFLIPIYFHSWQAAGRPAFYDANIINAASYNKAYIMDAIKRFQILMDVNLKDMNLEEPPKAELQTTWSVGSFQRERYDSLAEHKIMEIKNSYGINYFVTSSEKKYSFPVVYQNDRYKVYALD